MKYFKLEGKNTTRELNVFTYLINFTGFKDEFSDLLFFKNSFIYFI